jgi:hypothetical protein
MQYCPPLITTTGERQFFRTSFHSVCLLLPQQVCGDIYFLSILQGLTFRYTRSLVSHYSLLLLPPGLKPPAICIAIIATFRLFIAPDRSFLPFVLCSSFGPPALALVRRYPGAVDNCTTD